MSFLNAPLNNVIKSRRVPNAFMLFVKEQKKILKQNCPEACKSALGAYSGRKWRSMAWEEKQIYYNKYEALKKLETGNSGLRSVNDEERVESKNVLKTEVNEMMTGSCSNAVQLDSDTRKEKDSKSKKSNEIFSTDVVFGNETNLESCKTDIIPSPSTGNGIPIQKSVKKVRRAPNAYLLFAKEQRYNLDRVSLRDNKCHASTALGNMWKDLPASKKEKYKEEANILLNMQQKADCANMSSELEKNVKKKRKRGLKKRTKRPVGRPLKIPKNINLVPTPPDSRSFNALTAEQKEPGSHFIKRTGKVENDDVTQAVTEPQNSNDHSNASHLHHNSIVASHFHHAPATVEYQHSAFCNCRRPESTDTSNCNASFRQYPVPDTNIARSCFNFGSGYSQSLLQAYPFNTSYPFNNSPFWMHPHSMAPYMPYFPLSSISQSLYGCAFPYPAYPNAYFSSFFTGISDRCAGLFPGTSYVSSSAATANNSSNKNESVDASNNDHSGEELLIIDEDPEGKKPTESETGHCG